MPPAPVDNLCAALGAHNPPVWKPVARCTHKPGCGSWDPRWEKWVTFQGQRQRLARRNAETMDRDGLFSFLYMLLTSLASHVDY